MNRRIPKIIITFASIFATSCGSTGGGTGGKIPSTDNILVVDLHTFMPTGSGQSADLVSITATQDIANDFYAATGIKIKWFTGKSLDGEAEQASADYIKAIQNGTMPAIGFSWSSFVDRGYYLDVSEYLNTPNEFLTAEEQELYPTWKSQFPDYLWNTKECADAKGNIIAIPICLNPGPATGWFYNKTAFEGAGYDVPITWNQFRTLAIETQSETSGPFVYKQQPRITNWELLFSIGPSFANALSEVTDADKDGKVTSSETLEAVLAKKFSPLQSENPDYYQIAQGCYFMLKDFYKTMLPENWKTANSATCWSNGTALMRQNGLWCIRAENGEDARRSWKYGVFAAPLVSNDSSSFLQSKGLPLAASAIEEIETIQVPKKEYQISELSNIFINTYKPEASLYVNLMKHGIYDNAKVKENAIKFLKFMSTPENVSRICVDHQGILGGVKGATPGSSLKTWLQQEFPVTPNATWPDAYTVANNANINSALSKWVAGSIEDDAFFSLLSEEQLKGAQTYKDTLGKTE